MFTSIIGMTEIKKYTKWVAISVVIANMIGTGVFTSLGFQVGPLPSGFTILILWLVGGIIALCGAFAYAEISTIIKRSGGEYAYLSEMYHPSLGFVSGWISIFVGFAAPICAVAMAIGSYFAPVIGLKSEDEIMMVSALAIILLSTVQLLGVKKGGDVQNVLTAVKLIFILFFCVSPFIFTGFDPSSVSFMPASGDGDLIWSEGFAISLVYVYLAYSGWNASAYMAGSLENPKRTLPFSLIGGTLFVMVLYLVINAMFLYVTDFDELVGQLDIGNVVAIKLFGTESGKIFSGLFSLALISSLSAMIIAGPKVTETMGEDYKIFQQMTRKNKLGAPYIAISVQAIIALVLLFTSSFQEVMQYIGVGLSLFATLTVIGLFVLRIKKPNVERPFKAWGYPITPAIFVILNLIMIFIVLRNDEENNVVLFTSVTIVSGFVVYFLTRNNRTEEVTPSDMNKNPDNTNKD